MKEYIVHLATPNVKGDFEVHVSAESEHAALAEALKWFDNSYVVYTEEAHEESGPWHD